jgi:hypothetical protein
MKEIGEWLKEITAFPIAVGASDEKRIELTAFGAYPVAIEEVDGTVNVTCERELPEQVQGAIDMAELEQAAIGQARSAAIPALPNSKEIGGKQWVGFRLPLHLDGLTRNELATAIWGAWKAQELLALEILAYKELGSLSSKLDAPPEETQAASEGLAVPPEPTPPPAPAGLFCPKCGKQAKPDQRFCIGCGTSLEGQD